MQEQIRSMAASMVLEHITKRISKKSCKMYGFRIFCGKWDDVAHGRKEVSKESKKLNQHFDSKFSGMHEITNSIKGLPKRLLKKATKILGKEQKRKIRHQHTRTSKHHRFRMHFVEGIESIS